MGFERVGKSMLNSEFLNVKIIPFYDVVGIKLNRCAITKKVASPRDAHQKNQYSSRH